MKEVFRRLSKFDWKKNRPRSEKEKAKLLMRASGISILHYEAAIAEMVDEHFNEI